MSKLIKEVIDVTLDSVAFFFIWIMYAVGLQCVYDDTDVFAKDSPLPRFLE